MNDLFSVIVIVGIVLTFVPQYARVIRLKSSLGLSPYFLLLGITSVYAQLINILLLQISVFRKCRHEPDYACLSNLLGMVQVAVLAACITLNCCLYISYFPSRISSSEGKDTRRCIN